MIPSFPEFKKVDVSDRAAVESYTHRYSPYSDFNFTSLWSWDTSDERMISELNGNLVVLFTDYNTREPFCSFLGANKPDDTASELIKYAQNNGISPVLRLIPESSIIGLTASKFTVKEDGNNFDYLFSVPELATLSGLKFKEKRHMAARFFREYPNAHFEVEKLTGAYILEHITAVLHSWEKRKKENGKSYDIQHEKEAINRIFRTATAHKLVTSAIFLGDTMIGFSIDEILPNQYCISHFIKADTTYAGVYEFLNLKVAQHLASCNIALWNWEQDLGIEGLKDSKLGYRPVNFLKKYTVSFNEQGGTN